MLVLSRKRNESVVINGGECVVTVVEIRGDKVRLGFAAPKEIQIHREEVWVAITAKQEHPSIEADQEQRKLMEAQKLMEEIEEFSKRKFLTLSDLLVCIDES